MLNCRFTELNKAVQYTKESYPIPPQILAMKDLIAVDCGAHLGEFALAYSSLFKEIYAFEPSTEALYKTEENLKNKNITNCWLYRRACAATSGQSVRLYKNKNEWSEASSIYNSGVLSSNDFTDIYEECTTINLEEIFNIINFVSDRKGNEIDYLKVDIEMAEYDFLFRKNLSNVNCLAVEIHKSLFGPFKNELLKWLDQYFTIYSEQGATHWTGIFLNKKFAK